MSANETKTGFSFSIGTLILIALAIGATGSLIDALLYSANDEPVTISTVAEFKELEDGDYVRVTGTLDYDNAMVGGKAIGDTYLIAPVMGFHNGLWVSIKNGAMPVAEAKAATFTGRIAARDGSEWKIGEATDIDLAHQAEQHVAAPVTENALVLRDGIQPGDGLDAFTWITGVIGALILMAYAQAFGSAFVGLFRRRDEPVAVLQDAGAGS